MKQRCCRYICESNQSDSKSRNAVFCRDACCYCLLQEGKWNVLWLSGRFQTLVQMREDMPRGRVLSHSLKSSIFHAHDGEWRVM